MQQGSDRGGEAARSSPGEDASLTALLSGLLHDAEILLLQELALARAEIGENLLRFSGGAMVLLAGLLVALTGLLALIAAAILLLSGVMPPWAACLLAGGIVAAVGAALAYYGRLLMGRASLVPHRALAALRETEQWAREELT